MLLPLSAFQVHSHEQRAMLMIDLRDIAHVLILATGQLTQRERASG